MLHAPHIQNKHAKLNEIYVDSIHSTHMCATEISTQNTQSKCDSIPNLVLFWWFSTTWKNSTVKIIKRNIKMCLFVFSAQLAEYTLKMRTVTYLDSWIFTQQMLDDQSRDIIWCDTSKEWFTFFSPFNYHFALSIIVVRTDLILFWLFEYTNRFSSVNHTNSIKTGLLSKVWTRYLLAEVQSSRGRICIENSKATDKYWNISIPFSTNQYLLIPFEFSILVCPSNIMRFRTKEIFQQVTLMSKMTMIIFLLVSRHLKQNASYHGILFS